jgi:hypothetical protein
MNPRIRKLIGLPLLVGFLVAWVVGATMVAERLPDNFVLQLVFYVVAGTFWFVPILPLIYWMSRGR